MCQHPSSFHAKLTHHPMFVRQQEMSFRLFLRLDTLTGLIVIQTGFLLPPAIWLLHKRLQPPVLDRQCYGILGFNADGNSGSVTTEIRGGGPDGGGGEGIRGAALGFQPSAFSSEISLPIPP